MHMHMDRIPSERASQKKQNGTNFSSVSPSREELRAFEIHCCDDLYHGHTVELEASIGTHNSPLEGAMKLILWAIPLLIFMLLQMESFLTEVKVFVFIKKRLARIGTRNSSLEGAMKCNNALERPFLMEGQVKMFVFTKTMDYRPWF